MQSRSYLAFTIPNFTITEEKGRKYVVSDLLYGRCTMFI